MLGAQSCLVKTTAYEFLSASKLPFGSVGVKDNKHFNKTGVFGQTLPLNMYALLLITTKGDRLGRIRPSVLKL